jgi:hypothetical protein
VLRAGGGFLDPLRRARLRRYRRRRAGGGEARSRPVPQELLR